MMRGAVILIAVSLLVGLAAGFLLRPVVIKPMDTSAADSLRHEARKWMERSQDAEREADHYRARFDSLMANPVIVTKRIPHVQRTIHAGGLDAIRDSLLLGPSRSPLAPAP